MHSISSVGTGFNNVCRFGGDFGGKVMSDFIPRSYTDEIDGAKIVDGTIKGVELEAATVSYDKIKRTKGMLETFDTPPVYAGTAGGAALSVPGGTAGDVNVLMTRDNVLIYSPKGTQTFTAPAWAEATGLNVGMDQTANDGIEIFGSSLTKMTAGTDRFYFKAKIKLADVSGTDECAVGWRKDEAIQANIDDYDEAVFMNVISKDLNIETILNGGGTATVDTTDDVADTNYIICKITHDHEAGLTAAMALANDLKEKYNSHVADTAQHTTAADAVNVITSADATDLTSLALLTNELTTDYDAHEGDSELAAAWLYHPAQETGNDSLAAVTSVSTLPQCIKRLNDFRAKFNAHNNDATSHAVLDTWASTQALASSTTFQKGINTATLTAPTVITQFTFDDGEIVVPFFFFLHDTDICDTLHVMHWEVGTL